MLDSDMMDFLMGFETLQANFTAGELTPALHARPDLGKYQSGVAEALNMIILPHGGLRRRQGLAKQTYAGQTTEIRIVPFTFNQEQDYLIVLRPLAIDILKDGILQSTEVTPYLINELFEISIIQSADTMILAHQNHPPSELLRQGSDTAWLFQSIVFDNTFL